MKIKVCISVFYDIDKECPLLSIPMYFPSSSSSPRFLSLDPSLAEGGSGVFFPPPFPFPADFGLSFPPFPLSLPSAA